MKWFNSVGLGSIVIGCLTSSALLAQNMSAVAMLAEVKSAVESARVVLDVPYVDNGHARQRLDLYIPKGAKEPVPVVLWVHGGGWSAGSKTRTPAVALLPRGYAVVSVGYRLSQDAKFPAQIDDCQAALKWVRDHAKDYGLNASRVGVWGASAGGHLGALMGTTGNPDDHTDVQAVVDWFGPADFRTGYGSANQTNPIHQLLGASPTQDRAKASAASPTAQVSKDDAPFLIFHGAKDLLVTLSQSQGLHQALKDAGVESELVVLDNAGHGGREFLTPVMRDQIVTFFDKHLREANESQP